MPAVLLLSHNSGPASVSDPLLELLPAFIGMKIHSCTHGGIAKNVVANNYILRDRLNHGSLPHYQFTFKLPEYFQVPLDDGHTVCSFSSTQLVSVITEHGAPAAEQLAATEHD